MITSLPSQAPPFTSARIAVGVFVALRFWHATRQARASARARAAEPFSRLKDLYAYAARGWNTPILLTPPQERGSPDGNRSGSQGA
jgi:GAF domain-containing protein